MYVLLEASGLHMSNIKTQGDNITFKTHKKFLFYVIMYLLSNYRTQSQTHIGVKVPWKYLHFLSKFVQTHKSFVLPKILKSYSISNKKGYEFLQYLTVYLSMYSILYQRLYLPSGTPH